jgi:hypothetical protein
MFYPTLEENLPNYTLYLCWPSGREGIIPNIGPRTLLSDEIKRAKRHQNAAIARREPWSEGPFHWYEVRERKTGKVVFSTKQEEEAQPATISVNRLRWRQ